MRDSLISLPFGYNIVFINAPSDIAKLNHLLKAIVWPYSCMV